MSKKRKESLLDCLDTYFAKEFIDCEYKCDACKKKTSVNIFSFLFKSIIIAINE